MHGYGSMSRYGISSIALSVAVLSGCIPTGLGLSDPNDSKPQLIVFQDQTYVNLQNASSLTIAAVQIKLSTSDQWSGNMLFPPIKPGSTGNIGILDNGVWDIMAYAEDPNILWIKTRWALTGGTRTMSVTD